MLDGECTPEDVDIVELLTSEIEVRGVSRELSLLTPEDGLAVEGEGRVDRDIAQGVGYCLGISTEDTYMPVATEVALHGVGLTRSRRVCAEAVYGPPPLYRKADEL